MIKETSVNYIINVSDNDEELIEKKIYLILAYYILNLYTVNQKVLALCSKKIIGLSEKKFTKQDGSVAKKTKEVYEEAR